MAHRCISGIGAILTFRAKRTFSEPRLQNRIYEFAPWSSVSPRSTTSTSALSGLSRAILMANSMPMRVRRDGTRTRRICDFRSGPSAGVSVSAAAATVVQVADW